MVSGWKWLALLKERTAAAAQNVAERVEQLRGRYERWRHGGATEEGKLNSQTRSPAQETAYNRQAAPEQQQRAGPEPAPASIQPPQPNKKHGTH